MGRRVIVDGRVPGDTGAPAVVAGDAVLDRRALDELVDRYERLLRGFGDLAGQRIVLCLNNSPALCALVFATARVGGVWVVVDARTTPYQLAQIVEDSRPALVVTAPGQPVGPTEVTVRRERAGPLPAPPGTAGVLYTSGATRRPPGVGLNRGNSPLQTPAMPQGAAEPPAYPGP